MVMVGSAHPTKLYINSFFAASRIKTPLPFLNGRGVLINNYGKTLRAAPSQLAAVFCSSSMSTRSHRSPATFQLMFFMKASI